MIVLMISSGVALASHGELKFNLIGFLTQAAAVCVSTCRMVTEFNQSNGIYIVRGIALSHDPSSIAQSENGPARFVALLCARMRGDQSFVFAIHRRPRSFL